MILSSSFCRGVTRFGLFVRLDETGADGLVPVSSLGNEYFTHDDRAHALVGERSGQRYTLGRMVEVKLKEATPITGGLPAVPAGYEYHTFRSGGPFASTASDFIRLNVTEAP